MQISKSRIREGKREHNHSNKVREKMARTIKKIRKILNMIIKSPNIKMMKI